jgi:L-aspartate semialdehyde sulfurtransferase
MGKTIEEINERIKRGEAVVVTAEEIIDLVRKDGIEETARKVDVITTGTFSPMCSSGAFVNLGHAQPRMRISRAWLNEVPVFCGLAAVDAYIGATEMAERDPLNEVFPGEFRYGGGHVIEDLVARRTVHLRAESYGTDCYPNRHWEKDFSLDDINDAWLLNPRNGYQNYNVGVNLSEHIIYTYMGVLRPDLGNANYSSAGQLSPLLNDPLLRTTGIGTRIFLGGGIGYVIWHGTQHNTDVPRTASGAPTRSAATLSVIGDLKGMNPRYLAGYSILGYGASLAVGIGVPIPALDEDVVRSAAVRDEDLVAPVVDYSADYPQGTGRVLGEVTYAELKSGSIRLDGRDIPTASLSSYNRAREIATTLKDWISQGRFLLTQAVELLPCAARDEGVV